MSSQPNITLVRRLYEAKGNPAVAQEVMSPDVVWDISPGFPHGVVYTGLENVVQDFPIVLQQAADSHVAQQALSG